MKKGSIKLRGSIGNKFQTYKISNNASKTRAKNFSNSEITTLVELGLEDKPKLFSAFSSTLTFDEKNKIWEYEPKIMFSKNGVTSLLNTN